MKQKSVPCYVPNGGVHNIINVPMGAFVRLRLKKLVNKLLGSYKHFETFIAIQPEDADIKLLNALDAIMSLNLKPKQTRTKAKALLAAHEKNLKPTSGVKAEEEINLISLAISVGLIVILFLLAASAEYSENMLYNGL